MKPYRKQSKWLLTLIACAAVFSACGQGGGKGSDPNGYIRFSLQWPSPFASPVLSSLRGPRFAPSGDVCQDFLIMTINVNIYTSSNALVSSQSFSCAAHAGFVAVPPGTGYSVIIDGTTAAGTADWRGQKTGISVSQGQPTEAGAVAMAYIGTDTAKPSVASTTPANNATSVSVSNAVTAIFSENMAAFTIDTSTFMLSRGTVSVTGSVTYTSDNKTATFIPASPLADGTMFTATITRGAKDLALNALAANYSWSFTTAASSSGGSSLWDSMIWDTGVWN